MCQLKFLIKNVKSTGNDVVPEQGGSWMGFFFWIVFYLKTWAHIYP